MKYLFAGIALIFGLLATANLQLHEWGPMAACLFLALVCVAVTYELA